VEDALKTTKLLILALTALSAAHADFSYTQTTKGTAGPPRVTKYYYKGSRVLSDSDNTAHVMDFAAQTITTINKVAKTYSVQKMGETMPAGADAMAPQIELKETGQKKTINGFNCSQVMMTMTMDAPAGMPGGGKMQMEMELWISPDVPGWQTMRAFYQKNGSGMSAMAGGNPGMQKAMAEMQKKMATMNGMPVEEIVRMKSPAGGANPMAGMQNDPRMAQARAQLEGMIAQGGPQADAARKALARLPGGSGGGTAAPMFETTMDSSDFSTADVPESVFAIPAGFTKQ
jgi:hypothetical protein